MKTCSVDVDTVSGWHLAAAKNRWHVALTVSQMNMAQVPHEGTSQLS